MLTILCRCKNDIFIWVCVLCRHRPPLRPQRRVMKMRKPCHRMIQTPRRSSMVGSAASPIHQDVSEKYVCTPRVVLCVPLLTNCSLVHSCSEGQRWLWGGREISSGDGRSNQVCSMLRSSTKRSKEVEFEIKWECSELVFHMHLKFWLVSVCLHQSALFVQLMVASLASFNAFAVFSDAGARGPCCWALCWVFLWLCCSNIEKELSFDFGPDAEFTYLYSQCYELTSSE